MKKILFIASIVIVFNATPVFAVKQANFPDATSLQPMPEFVHPDLSNNMQRADDGSAAVVQLDQGTDDTVVNGAPGVEDISTAVSVETVPSKNTGVRTLLFAALGILVIAGLLRVRKSLK